MGFCYIKTDDDSNPPPDLQQLRCLYDVRERLDDVDLLRVDLLVARPLLQLRRVVPEGR